MKNSKYLDDKETYTFESFASIEEPLGGLVSISTKPEGVCVKAYTRDFRTNQTFTVDLELTWEQFDELQIYSREDLE